MKKLAIILATSATFGVAAVPAGAQDIYVGYDGYRWSGPTYTYSHRYYSPRANVYVYRDRPYYSYGRSYRSWENANRSYWTRGPGDD